MPEQRMQIKTPMFQDAHRGCLLRLQSAHVLLDSSLTSCLSVAWFCAERSTGRLDMMCVSLWCKGWTGDVSKNGSGIHEVRKRGRSIRVALGVVPPLRGVRPHGHGPRASRLSFFSSTIYYCQASLFSSLHVNLLGHSFAHLS